MTETQRPKTLADLLAVLEASADLAPFARECGLSIRELRRRLSRWRRELTDPEAGTDTGKRPTKAKRGGGPGRSVLPQKLGPN